MAENHKKIPMPGSFNFVPRKPREWPKVRSLAEHFDTHDQADWDQLSRQQYKITARGYFNRSYNLYPRSFEDYSLLFYCAFELRCAIERVIYECLLNLTDEKLPKTISKLWAADDLKAAIFKIDPDFFWKVQLVNIVSVAQKKRSVLPLKNLHRLLRDYGLLHVYLHAQRGGARSPSISSPLWWHTFRDLIESLHISAWRYCAGCWLKVTLDKTANAFLEDLKSGTITCQQLINKIRIEKPDFAINGSLRRFLE